MRIGIFLVVAQFPGQDSGLVLANAVELIVAAEKAGFDDVWIAEHHFMSYGVCPSAIALAGVALGRTSRIGVGTAVSVLSQRHPVALAEEAAMLHHLSGGRFRLGVGRGGPWVDLEVFGTGLPRFERGFAESLDLLCAALSGEPVSGEGEFFRFREVSVVPSAPLRPVVACTSDATLALAAARGLPMLLGMHVDDREKATAVAAYESLAADRRGDGPADRRGEHPAVGRGNDLAAERSDHLTVGPGGQQADERGDHLAGERVEHLAAVVGYVGDSTRRAVAELRASMPRWLGPGLAGYIPIDGKPRPPRDVRKYVDFLTRVHPVGSADHCVETIQRTVATTGIQHLILMVEGMGEHARTLENIRRLGAEVLPRV